MDSPPNEYFIDPHAVHLSLPKIYPALHDEHLPFVASHFEQPVHVLQDEAFAEDHVVRSHALQAEVLPDGEYVPAEHCVQFPLE